MIEIYKHRPIVVEWAVYRHRFAQRENFGGARIKCHLVGDSEKETLPTKEQNGSISVDVGSDLPRGVYTLILSYTKDGKTERIVIENAFAVAENVGNERGFITDTNGSAVLCISSSV